MIPAWVTRPEIGDAVREDDKERQKGDPCDRHVEIQNPRGVALNGDGLRYEEERVHDDREHCGAEIAENAGGHAGAANRSAVLASDSMSVCLKFAALRMSRTATVASTYQ